MVAFSIILVEFTLSGRFRTLSHRVGLDTTLRLHRLIARTALAAALLHPFLFRAERNPPYPWDVTRDLTVISDLGLLWSGIVAWLLLPTFVLLAISRGRPSYRYDGWRWGHAIGAAVIGALLLHHTLVAGRYADDPTLAWFWIGLSGVALVSFLWVHVAVPLGQIRRPWRVVGIERAADRIWRVEIAPRGHDGLAYRAGQFAWLNIGHSPFNVAENPFSISSAPASGRNLSFLIKELGDFTSSLGRIATGTPAYLDAPHGTLTPVGRQATGIALIAGGIGIAPLLGILRQLDLEDDPHPRKLVYADRGIDQIVHRDELARLGRAENVAVELVLETPPEGWTGARGRVDLAFLAARFSDEELSGWLFFLCGPPAMMNSVERALIELGVPADRILSERFDYD
ncbi:ferric reductase-like transmembrane domain-containing protein [Maribius pontilimi]|uniref:Ferric reductase-like transmembrane domain-containing protein n=1 Tax=Palleronia pontilimi TaxID=1964209 RepID=A0A934IAW8_9RHOB|nr:ferric reductase-like transmembrane domain-containing protein [Palleronia pontilimi]MBJ3763719.1 ferric reductase-like transmembrane domain-containing protein [Palleronia pontilimi]